MASSGERALAIRDAFGSRLPGHVLQRGARRLVMDELPSPVLDKAGAIVGVSMMVRFFTGLTEIRIDPHRVIINPPLVPRANLTYKPGMDSEGRPVERRIVGLVDPEAALVEALWDSVEGTPNAKGWRTRGTVTTVYATVVAGNGSVLSTEATYATARTGGSLTVADKHLVGQRLSGGIYDIYEPFLIFDTSGIPDTDTVSAVVLSLDGSSDTSTTDFTAGVCASSYNGGPVVTTDWVSGAAIPTPELATWNSSGYSADYNAFTETADFKTAINKTGNTSLMLYSQRHRDATPPPDLEYVVFMDADAAGTTRDPKLDITHATGAQTVTMTALLGPATSVFAPVAAGPITISALIGPATTVYAPQVDLTLSIGGAIGPATSVFAPAVNLGLAIGALIGPGTAIYAPQVDQGIAISAAIGPATTVYAPVVGNVQTLTMTAIVGPATSVFAPVVAGPITIEALIGPATIVYAPQPTLIVQGRAIAAARFSTPGSGAGTMAGTQFGSGRFGAPGSGAGRSGIPAPGAGRFGSPPPGAGRQGEG